MSTFRLSSFRMFFIRGFTVFHPPPFILPLPPLSSTLRSPSLFLQPLPSSPLLSASISPFPPPFHRFSSVVHYSWSGYCHSGGRGSTIQLKGTFASLVYLYFPCVLFCCYCCCYYCFCCLSQNHVHFTMVRSTMYAPICNIISTLVQFS